ncbi:hypothetical protein [Kutzneria chonburiensis]|uniref:Uncharacterized protein n=1 Tax=Kutzneria chonburiensis TaxID=1483604 RepID=A0ABV6N3Y2_9PSEU|nr:hypothetical protein [Kutzneria chonburiensis]
MKPRVSAGTTVTAAVLALAIVVISVVRQWTLPGGVSLLLEYGGVLEILFELVLPVLVPLLLLVAAILMLVRVPAGRPLAVVGAALVIAVPVAVFAIVGQFPWDISRSAGSAVLLYLPIALAVILIVVASAPVTGAYLRSKGASAAT